MPMTYDQIKFAPQKKPRAGKTFVCEYCGRSFYLTPSQAADPFRGRFCSRACQKAFHAVEKTCPTCGKIFSIPRGQADRYTVCSWKCRATAQRMYSCVHCGKEFISHETRWEPKYCSVACYRKSKAETSIEKKVRQTLEQMSEPFIQEHKIGRYSVDFFLPRINGVIEADGAYWHRNKARDARKNAFLNTEGVHLIRLPEKAILGDDLVSLLRSWISEIM